MRMIGWMALGAACIFSCAAQAQGTPEAPAAQPLSVQVEMPQAAPASTPAATKAEEHASPPGSLACGAECMVIGAGKLSCMAMGDAARCLNPDLNTAICTDGVRTTTCRCQGNQDRGCSTAAASAKK